MDLMKAFNDQYMKDEAPTAQIGDTVRVHILVKEGSRDRIQVFEGPVIAKKHGGSAETIPASAWRRCSPSTLPP